MVPALSLSQSTIQCYQMVRVFVNIRPYRIMKICPFHRILAKVGSKILPNTNHQIPLKFCQNGEISPKLVTLPPSPTLSHYFWITIKPCFPLMFCSFVLLFDQIGKSEASCIVYISFCDPYIIRYLPVMRHLALAFIQLLNVPTLWLS